MPRLTRRLAVAAFCALVITSGSGVARSYSGNRADVVAASQPDLTRLDFLSRILDPTTACSNRIEIELARRAIQRGDRETALVHLRSARRLFSTCRSGGGRQGAN